VSSYRDLGVTISSDLAPSLHITDIVGKARGRANMIGLHYNLVIKVMISGVLLKMEVGIRKGAWRRV